MYLKMPKMVSSILSIFYQNKKVWCIKGKKKSNKIYFDYVQMKEFRPKDPMDKVNRKMLSVNTSQCLKLQCLECPLLETTAEKTAAPVEKEQWTWRSICRRGKPQAWEESPGSQARGDAKRSYHFTPVRIQVGRLPDFRHWKDRGWGKKSRNRCLRK